MLSQGKDNIYENEKKFVVSDPRQAPFHYVERQKSKKIPSL